MWWVVIPTGNTAPNATQVRAGTDGSSVAATATNATGGTSVSGTSFTANATGLSASTGYKVYFTQDDLFGNHATAVGSSTFTTASGSAASAFITRAQGVGTYDSTHQTAITTFINGLITDSLMASDGTSSIFDILYIFAAPLSGHALLNIVANGNFNGTANGSPTFTADSGYTGTDGSSTKYIDTGFNPITATTPNMAQNSAHASIWLDDITAATTGGNDFGCMSGGHAMALNIRFSDQICYDRPNMSDGAGGFTPGARNKGLWLINRSGASATQTYNNSSSTINTSSIASTTSPSLNMYVLNLNLTGSPSGGSGRKAMAFSAGASMNSTQVGNFQSRLDAYLVTIAGIAY
jgi:hypothetical protein